MIYTRCIFHVVFATSHRDDDVEKSYLSNDEHFSAVM